MHFKSISTVIQIVTKMNVRCMRVGGGRPMPRLQLSPTQLGLFCTMFVAPLLFTSSIAPCLVGADQPPKTAASGSGSAADACFCKIDSGVLEDCPCTTDAVKNFNYDLHPKVCYVIN